MGSCWLKVPYILSCVRIAYGWKSRKFPVVKIPCSYLYIMFVIARFTWRTNIPSIIVIDCRALAKNWNNVFGVICLSVHHVNVQVWNKTWGLPGRGYCPCVKVVGQIIQAGEHSKPTNRCYHTCMYINIPAMGLIKYLTHHCEPITALVWFHDQSWKGYLYTGRDTEFLNLLSGLFCMVQEFCYVYD